MRLLQNTHTSPVPTGRAAATRRLGDLLAGKKSGLAQVRENFFWEGAFTVGGLCYEDFGFKVRGFRTLGLGGSFLHEHPGVRPVSWGPGLSSTWSRRGRSWRLRVGEGAFGRLRGGPNDRKVPWLQNLGLWAEGIGV